MPSGESANVRADVAQRHRLGAWHTHSNLAIALTTFGIAAFTSAVYERKSTANTFPQGYTPTGQTGDTIIATLSFVGTFLCLYGQTVCCHQKSTYSNKGSTLLVLFATISFILGVIVGGLVPIIVNNSAQSNLSWLLSQWR